MKQKTWIAVILLGTVAANGVAFVVMKGRRGADASAPTAVTAEPSRTPPATVASVTPPPPAAPQAPPEEDANAGLARARRAAGLAALEDRDYETAVAEFTEALRLRRDDKGDLVELLRIAAELRTREQERTRADRTQPTREPAPAPVRETKAKAKPTRVASRTPAREEPAAAAEPRNGLLLVTSTPPGLTVLVDGKTVDLTPARIPLRAGTYRVALAQGERKLAEESVELGEDDVRSLNRDLTAELAPQAPRPAATPAPATAAAPAPTSPAAEAAAQPAARTEPPAVAKSASTGRGGLDVTSPALYGEVWINNRPYGFPPVKAEGLPAGPARVEVRVNGVVKRKMTVEVEPDRLTAVRVR
ncbi:PEGA domain-containing protein [Myxococcus sp. RHSTA-1-4]|uniref:PEGA domain-containing protein n=1 Tax=Myxococcus sp. RHSTA-1-4 TaxID=2874601 RepID=UPI001CBCEB22|nr:PEGA domain-containing protein [Myxococcus sp. RHSTA-1-4]MBZ4416203.1 PEGA domain-containing protein [Myxococcus sp. RHSTA-1-4]